MPEFASTRPLGIRQDLRLSAEQEEMILALEGADLWFVEERLARKGLVAAERIPGAIVEFKRYMGLVGLGYRGLGMLSREVDEVWHALILFTKEYDSLCRSAFGAFIHHVPRTSRSPQGATDDGARFLTAYQEVFGDVPADWYGVPQVDGAAAGDPSGCGTEDCTDG